ncbi:MAG: hypothetical protein AAFW46_13255 [Pseudomonadota bacterium]
MTASRILAAGLIALTIGAVSPAKADDEILGCPDGLQSYPQEQVKEQVGVVRDTGQDPFLRMLALEELLCASTQGVRMFAIRAALESQDETLRARAFLAAVMQRANLVVEFDRAEGLKKQTYDAINARGGAIAFEIRKRDYAEKTLTIYNGKIDVSGVVLSISQRGSKGAFELQPDGALKGLFYIDKVEEGAPATIKLY